MRQFVDGWNNTPLFAICSIGIFTTCYSYSKMILEVRTVAGHYLRVQEAASLLGVAPPTIRWYCSQGMLPTYWIGRGTTGHRRFLYQDVETLARELGRGIPAERVWDREGVWKLKDAALYLGLSTKFLVDGGFVKSGVELTWEQLQEVERSIYGDKYDAAHETDFTKGTGDDEVEHNSMDGMRGCKHGHGMHDPMERLDRRSRPEFGRRANGRMIPPWPPMSPWQASKIDPTDLLALKSAKRHLEAQKADIEDQIEDLVRKIESHPDYEG